MLLSNKFCITQSGSEGQGGVGVMGRGGGERVVVEHRFVTSYNTNKSRK